MTITDKEYRKKRIDTLADNVAKLADRFDALSDDAVRHALDGMLNKRTGRMLAARRRSRNVHLPVCCTDISNGIRGPAICMGCSVSNGMPDIWRATIGLT